MQLARDFRLRDRAIVMAAASNHRYKGLNPAAQGQLHDDSGVTCGASNGGIYLGHSAFRFFQFLAIPPGPPRPVQQRHHFSGGTGEYPEPLPHSCNPSPSECGVFKCALVTRCYARGFMRRLCIICLATFGLCHVAPRIPRTQRQASTFRVKELTSTPHVPSAT